MRYVFILEAEQEPDDSTKIRFRSMLTSLGVGLAGAFRVYDGEIENEHLLTDPNDLASSKQLWYLNKLVNEADEACLDSIGTERGEILAEALVPTMARIAKGSLTKSDASTLIDTLKGALDS